MALRKQLGPDAKPTTFDITFDDQNANWAYAIWMNAAGR